MGVHIQIGDDDVYALQGYGGQVQTIIKTEKKKFPYLTEVYDT